MMKKKPLYQKCKHEKKKEIKAKMQPICITINLRNTNKMCNRNIQKNKHIARVNTVKVLPPPVEHCRDFKPQPGHGFIPPRGELVINGGFENQPDPFQGWIISAGVEPINIYMGDIPHQGFNAARLGTANTRSYIYQDVPGVCPGLFYQYSFFLSASSRYGNEIVIAQLKFLDHNRNLLNDPGLDIYIPKNSLSNESYAVFINATRIPAPHHARFARVSFIVSCEEHLDKAVHLDDVSLIAI